MSRLKALLRVATPSTCNTQQTGAFDVQQSVTTSEEVYFPQQNAQQNTQNSAQFVADDGALLRVAHPSTCNTQQTVMHAPKAFSDVQQDTRSMQQSTQNSAQFVAQKKELLHAAHGVAQHVHTAQQADWQEFEALLAIVAPAHRTPTHELDEIRAAARDDLAAALVAYRAMFKALQGTP
jgi:hypothetical protein